MAVKSYDPSVLNKYGYTQDPYGQHVIRDKDGNAVDPRFLEDTTNWEGIKSHFYDGMPKAPEDQMSGVTLDRTGLDKFKQEAFRSGPSMWAQLSQQQQGQRASEARSSGAAQVNAGTQKAMDDLGMSGGLTSGARERLAGQGARSMLDMNQQVGQQESQNNLQIGINDEQNRISQLSQVPGMDLSAGGFDMNKANAQNQFGAQNYQTQGGIWAAGQQANAMDPRNPTSPNYDDHKRWYNPFSW